MQFSLDQIETFYWVARLGSFHAAARHLRLTQPAISVRIQGLEQDLGAVLFQRLHSKARLSPAGLAILPQAEHMLTLAAELRRDVVIGRGMHGLLRLGVVETVARLALPDLLAYLSAQYEGLRVQIVVDIGSALSLQLYERELDVVINTDPRPREQTRVEALGRLAMSWIASAQHPLAKSKVKPSDLRKDRVFTNSKGSTGYDLTEAWFRAGGIEPEHMNMCNSISTIATVVAAGQGVAVVAPAMFKDEIANGQIVRLSATPALPSRPLLFCCLPEIWNDDLKDLANRTRQCLEKASAFVRS